MAKSRTSRDLAGTVGPTYQVRAHLFSKTLLLLEAGFPGINGRTLKLTVHLRPVQRLGFHGAILILPLTSSCRVH